MKSAIIFPGYGAQYVGMGKELYDGSRVMQEYFEEAANCLSINFVKLCFAASDVELGRIMHAYPALFLLGVSLTALLKNEGIEPAVVAGYDIGQLAALHAAGSLNFPDGLYLLSKYAAFFQEFLNSLSTQAIHVQNIDVHELTQICRSASQDGSSLARIAFYEAHDSYVVAGATEAVDRCRSILADHPGVVIGDAAIECGLHSALVEGVAASVRVYSEKTDFHNAQVPVITNTDGLVVQEGSLLKERTLQMIDTAVCWDLVIKQLEAYDPIIQIGPGHQLLSAIAHAYPHKRCIAVNKQEDIDTLKAMMSVLPSQE